MAMDPLGSQSLLAYQGVLAQGGTRGQAVAQALAAGRAQATGISAMVSSAGSVDPVAALSGGSASQALTSLAFDTSSDKTSAVKAMLATLGGSSGLTSLFTNSDGVPISAAALSPGPTAALVRYAYSQTQDPAEAARQALATAQQTQQASALNLLA